MRCSALVCGLRLSLRRVALVGLELILTFRVPAGLRSTTQLRINDLQHLARTDSHVMHWPQRIDAATALERWPPPLVVTRIMAVVGEAAASRLIAAAVR